MGADELMRGGGLSKREVAEMMFVRDLDDETVLSAARNEGGPEQKSIQGQMGTYPGLIRITNLCAVEAFGRGLIEGGEAELILKAERFSYNARAVDAGGGSVPDSGVFGDMDVYADFTVVNGDHEEALGRVRDWAQRTMSSDPRVRSVSVSRSKRTVGSTGPWQPDRYHGSIGRTDVGLSE
ncbi:hypothetical protein E1091_00190 [Micromonospora fluostatini]|uniref:Uncharacterized protein n=1 Tax=Micromonospora fluostatini TaxID=1629071 RepID=A0ABY2DM87_9ACTN|nr:hypothetical protein E1091_00190 [Micromonospora fluostatini]